MEDKKKTREEFFNKTLQRKEFPKDAIQVYDAFKDKYGNVVKELIGYKPQYVIERLNDIFGYSGWGFEVLEEKESLEEGKGHVGAKVMLKIFNENGEVISSRTQWGNSKISSLGLFEAKKGAITNAIGKCAAFYDIGHEAYKGEEYRDNTEKPYDEEVVKKPIKEVPEKGNIKPAPKEERPTITPTKRPVNERALKYAQIKELLTKNTNSFPTEKTREIVSKELNVPQDNIPVWDVMTIEQLSKVYEGLCNHLKSLP